MPHAGPYLNLLRGFIQADAALIAGIVFIMALLRDEKAIRSGGRYRRLRHFNRDDAAISRPNISAA